MGAIRVLCHGIVSFICVRSELWRIHCRHNLSGMGKHGENESTSTVLQSGDMILLLLLAQTLQSKTICQTKKEEYADLFYFILILHRSQIIECRVQSILHSSILM